MTPKAAISVDYYERTRYRSRITPRPLWKGNRIDSYRVCSTERHNQWWFSLSQHKCKRQRSVVQNKRNLLGKGTLVAILRYCFALCRFDKTRVRYYIRIDIVQFNFVYIRSNFRSNRSRNRRFCQQWFADLFALNNLDWNPM